MSSLLADRFLEARVGQGRVLALPTPAQEIVSFRGSFASAPDVGANDELVQSLVARLLDKGTRNRTRPEIADALEDRGARLNFFSDGLRMGFGGKALTEDLPFVLGLAAECLRESALLDDESAFDQEIAREAAQSRASLQQAMESTGAQASGALSRRIYTPAHPNYHPHQTEELAQLESLTPEDVRRFYRHHVSASDLILCIAGDVDTDREIELVRSLFGDWIESGREARFDEAGTVSPPTTDHIQIPDRQNLDVRLGHALHVKRADDDYLPLHVANYALGGNFSSRLMSEVRDQKGLTYGIGSALFNIDVEQEGHWHISVTLSQDRLEEGVAATRAVLEEFAHGGITEDELDRVKDTVAGSFVVGLASTGQLTASLMVNAERGFPASYLDEYPGRVKALTLAEVNDTVRRHYRPEMLHLAVAGSISG